jgi:hypothetical protein
VQPSMETSYGENMLVLIKRSCVELLCAVHDALFQL